MATVLARRRDGDAPARQEAARLAALFGPVLVRSGTRIRPDTHAGSLASHFVAHFVVVDGMNADHLILEEDNIDD